MGHQPHHPFGHGRMEYISALIVAFLVMEVGFTFLKDAIAKIREPQELQFHLVSTCILILSVGVKLWLGMFNKKLGTKIDSKVMLATAEDSMGDVLATGFWATRISEITEDDLKNGENELQKITDEFVKKLDEVAAAKTKEIMEI